MTINKEDLIDSMQMVADVCRNNKECKKCIFHGKCFELITGPLCDAMQLLIDEVNNNDS